MREKRSVFLGIMLLLGAAALLVSKLGYLDDIGFWPVVFTVCLAGVLIAGIFKKNFTMILFAAAFWVILNDKLLKLEAITPWPVLGAAALGSIGMGMLFGAARSRRSIMWGIMFLAGAAVLIVSRLGYLEGIGFWTIVLTIFFGGILLEGIFKGNFWMILFSIAFLIIVNDGLLKLEAITPWPVLGAALLGSIGMQMLFPGCRKHIWGDRREWDSLVNASERRGVRAYYYYESNFGEMVRYISGEISKVDLSCNFGSLQVYFTDAQLQNGTAKVDAEVNFGSMVLYIPSSWKVELDVENAFGGTEEKGKCNLEGGKVLYIEGEVNFGHLQIRYV